LGGIKYITTNLLQHALVGGQSQD